MKLRMLFCGGLLAIAAASHSLTITFDALGSAGTGSNVVASGYTDQGCVFTSDIGGGSAFRVFQTSNSLYPGSPALENDWPTARTTLARSDGSAFDMVSIGLVNYFLQNAPGQTINFTGTRADSSTVQNAITLTSPTTMTSYNFTEMTNIVSLRWQQLNPYHQFDNVTLVSTVPEPVAIVGLGLGAVGIYRRRKR